MAMWSMRKEITAAAADRVEYIKQPASVKAANNGR